MLRRLVLLLVSVSFLFIYYSCSDSKNNRGMTKEQSEKADEFIRKADSLRMERMKMMHKNFVGKHRHKKNLAVHAHQNIPAKVRRMKNSARLRERKRELANAKRQAQIEQLKSKGLYRDEGEE